MNVKDIRRKNTRSLASTAGGISSLAKRLSKSQSQISHLIGKKPIKNIGDKLAAQIETMFNKPHGWLDKDHEDNLLPNSTSFVSQDFTNYFYAPLLSWEQAKRWPAEKEILLASAELIPTQLPLGRYAFAIKMQGDSMESPSGICFPNGCTIFIDPDHEPTHESFVLAKLPAHEELCLKQLILDGENRYLRTLNPRYPIVEMNNQVILYGVARQLSILLS